MGDTHIPLGAPDKVQEICTKWREHGREGLMIVVGGTNRVPIKGVAAYESNLNLAQERAEEVKKAFVACSVAPERIIAVVSGPRGSAWLSGQGHLVGDVEERRVDVWGIFVDSRPAGDSTVSA